MIAPLRIYSNKSENSGKNFQVHGTLERLNPLGERLAPWRQAGIAKLE
jgi:hypothetical protein